MHELLETDQFLKQQIIVNCKILMMLMEMSDSHRSAQIVGCLFDAEPVPKPCSCVWIEHDSACAGQGWSAAVRPGTQVGQPFAATCAAQQWGQLDLLHALAIKSV